jgi:hypothetical protein
MTDKTLTFTKEKETKNTIRYQETTEANGKIIIGSLYIQKSFLEANPPESLSVTITF